MVSAIPQPLATGQDFLDNLSLSAAQHRAVLDTAHALKQGALRGQQPLRGQTLAMLFEKPSLRTRSTFEIAMVQLGGHALVLSQQEVGLGSREPAADVARNLERWVDGIMARVFSHDTLLELAQYSSKPVINGLSDWVHPVQVLADYQTIEENFGPQPNLKVVYMGDGNNMAHAHIQTAVYSGVDLWIATPVGFEPDPQIVEQARSLGARISLTHHPLEAAQNAQVLYTDVWVSMGQESAAGESGKTNAFEGFQVTPAVLDTLHPEGIFLHCLPAHYGEEVTREAIDHPRSRVFDQAENRLHAQKALLFHLLAGSQ